MRSINASDGRIFSAGLNSSVIHQLWQSDALLGLSHVVLKVHRDDQVLLKDSHLAGVSNRHFIVTRCGASERDVPLLSNSALQRPLRFRLLKLGQ